MVWPRTCYYVVSSLWLVKWLVGLPESSDRETSDGIIECKIRMYICMKRKHIKLTGNCGQLIEDILSSKNTRRRKRMLHNHLQHWMTYINTVIKTSSTYWNRFKCKNDPSISIKSKRIIQQMDYSNKRINKKQNETVTHWNLLLLPVQRFNLMYFIILVVLLTLRKWKQYG